jgi:hypothetical protein
MSVVLLPVAVLNHESEDEALLSHAHYTLCIFPTKDSIVSIDPLHTMQALENRRISVKNIACIPQFSLSPKNAKHRYAESTC